MIVSNKGYFPKQYKSDYTYCLMVGDDNKVKMVWNYNARTYMYIVNEKDVCVNGEYTVDEIKKGLKLDILKFKFF